MCSSGHRSRAAPESLLRGHLCNSRTPWTFGGTEMGAAPRLCLGLKHVLECSQRWPPGSAAVRPPERLWMGCNSVQCSGCTWQPQHSEVAAPAWLPVGMLDKY